MEVYFILNGTNVEYPINYNELSIELNYDKDASFNTSISLQSIVWGVGDRFNGGDAATILNNIRIAGVNGGVGVFEGVPLLINIEHNGVTYTVFDGYVNLATAEWECDTVTCDIVERKKTDWFNSLADSKDFEYMHDVEGLIANADVIKVPYVLSSIPNNREAFLTIISLFVLGNALRNAIKDLKGSLEAMTGSGGIMFGEAFRIVTIVAYIVVLVASIVVTLKQLIDLLIQPIKYHTAMSERKLCEVGAASFGFSFASSILENTYNNSYIIPEKYAHPIDVNSNGVEILGIQTTSISVADDKGWYKGTFGDLLRALKEKYNGKVIFDGNIMRLEREDYNPTNQNYIIPDVEDLESYKYNYEDFKANYIVRFNTDFNDKQTVDRYNGTEIKRFTSPLTVNNSDYVLTKDREERLVPFARGVRKTELTWVEETVKSFLSVIEGLVNTIISIINQIIDIIRNILNGITKLLKLIGINPNLPSINNISPLNLTGLITDRIGMLLMENDFIQVPKNIILDVSSNARYTKVSTLDSSLHDAEYLYNNYHKLRSFTPSTEFPNANQYIQRQAIEVPFCFDDYELVRNSNIIQNADLKNGRALSIKWNVFRQVADIDYEINELYTTNLKDTISKQNGR